MKRINLTAARLVLALVFLYFGAGELVTPGPWVGYLPPFVPTPLGVWFVLLHGFVLFTAGVGLILGAYWRILAPIAVVLMGSVALELLFRSGPSAIWIRDVGLTGLALSLWATDGGWLVEDSPANRTTSRDKTSGKRVPQGEARGLTGTPTRRV